MANTLLKLFAFGAFMSALFIQHPNFHKDFLDWIGCSSLGADGASRLPITSVIFILVILLFVIKRAQKYYAAQQNAGGVGLRLHTKSTMGWLVVEVRMLAVTFPACDLQWQLPQVVPDGPGDLKGIQIGDCITHVDGIPVSALKSIAVIRGPIGSSVALRLQRGIPGSRELAAVVAEEGASSQIATDPSSDLPEEVTHSEDSVEEVILVLERKAFLPANPAKPDDKKSD